MAVILSYTAAGARSGAAVVGWRRNMRTFVGSAHRQNHHPRKWVRTHFAYHGPGSFGAEEGTNPDGTATTAVVATIDSSSSVSFSLHPLWKQRDFQHRAFTVGIGGPVGSGKTATVLALCQALSAAAKNTNTTTGTSNERTVQTPPRLAVVTNDIFTQEDAEFLQRHQALPANRIVAVETGGCPHAAIREDVSANLTALETLTRQMQKENDEPDEQSQQSLTPPPLSPILLLCESGGDNLAANFSRELADLTLYVIDVAGGDKVPRKGGPGITQSDLLIVNKIDLAPAVGADLEVMRRDADRMRTASSSVSLLSGTGGGVAGRSVVVGPTLFCAVKHGVGVPEICDFILQNFYTAMALHSNNTNNNINISNDKHDRDHTGSHDHHHHHHHNHDHHQTR